MIRIELHHLETLLWIHKLGTFAAAAERLNTTQPGISARVREAESRLGARLFKRQGRRMVLTVRGRNLVAQCEPLLNQLQRVLLATEDFSVANGIVRMGVGEIAALSCLPALAAQIKRDMPSVTLEIDVDLTINLRQKLAMGSLDLALIVGPVEDSHLQSSSLGPAPMLWLGESSLVADMKRRRIGVKAMFEQFPVWCLSRPSHLYGIILDIVRSHGASAKNVNTCNHVEALIEIIAAGAGVGILPEKLARDRISSGRLTELTHDIKAVPVEFFVVMPRSEDDPLLNELFRRASLMRVDC